MAKVQPVSLRDFGFFGRTVVALCFSDPTPIRSAAGGEGSNSPFGPERGCVVLDQPQHLEKPQRF